MESRFRNNKRIMTKDFEQEVEFLKQSGKMPTLEQVVKAMAEAWQGYRNSLQVSRTPIADANADQ